MTQAGTNLIIGIDVSKDKLDIYILPNEEHFVVENTRNKISQFIRKLGPKGTIGMIVMEATGGYETLAFELFSMSNLPVHIAHPNKVFYYGKAKGYFAKTDKSDAKMIANYGLENKLEKTIFNKDQQHMQSISARMIQIKDDLRTTRCRLSAPSLNADMKKSLKRQESWLVSELKILETKMNNLIAKDDSLSEIKDIITSVKGVGEGTANLLICQMKELGKLNKQEIAALSGLAPRNQDSGRKVGARKITGGKEDIRKSLYLCALSASKYNTKLKELYNRLIAKGKKPKVALIAVARKLIVIINHLVAKKTKWEDGYEKNTITA